MSLMILTFQTDPKSQIPELSCDTVPLPDHIRRNWEEELKVKYPKLQTGRISSLKFKHTYDGYPTEFDVRVVSGGDRRKKTVVLTSKPDVKTSLVTSTPTRGHSDQHTTCHSWQEAFLSELQRFQESLPEKGAVKLGLAMVLEELQQLKEKHPETLSLLLLGGYLHVAEKMCEQRGDAQRLCYYVAAGQLLADACDTKLPEEAVPRPYLGRPLGQFAVVSEKLSATLWRMIHPAAYAAR